MASRVGSNIRLDGIADQGGEEALTDRIADVLPNDAIRALPLASRQR